MPRHPRAAIGAAAITLATPAHAQPILFAERAADFGLGPNSPASGFSTGVNAADIDGDGDHDLFVPQGWTHPDRLYLNALAQTGTALFIDAAPALGLASTANNRTALLFDYDGDDDLDLALASDTYQRESIPDQNALRLFRNDGADGFTDVSQQAGFEPAIPPSNDLHAGGMAAGDLDGDGDLDLVACLWEGRTRVYLNNADGTFTEAGVETGIGAGIATTWQPILADFNRDGRTDVLLSHDFAPNNLYINLAPDPFAASPIPRFEDRAPAASIDTAFNEMGVAPGDPDNDGDLDIYMTNIYGAQPGSSTLEHNVLFRNDSPESPAVLAAPVFAERAKSLGIDAGGVGWGTLFADLDHDTREDLAAVSTFEFPAVPNRLWRNTTPPDGPLAFTDAATAAGFDSTDPSTSLVALDHDGDRDIDLLVPTLTGALRLYENQLAPAPENTDANALVVRLRAPGMNRRAIGATVTATLPDGTTLTRLITAGSSFAGQHPAEAHLGLGPHASVTRLDIAWPDGTTSSLDDIPANQTLTVTSPCPCGSAPYDLNGDARADVEDLHSITQSPRDLNGDGDADQTDVDCLERYLRRFEQRDRGEQRGR
jgi:hypothetical protein